jgi:hypothetical protein
MGYRRLVVNIDLRRDVDDDGLLTHLEQELSTHIEELLDIEDRDALVLDVVMWTEEVE